jgi:ribosome-associated translation inhibitor RaiA
MVGFKGLDDSEIKVVQEIILNSLNKINKKVTANLIRVELKQHKHAKEFMHEIKAVLFLKGNRISASASNKNMYKAVKETLDKLIAEIGHLKQFKDK